MADKAEVEALARALQKIERKLDVARDELDDVKSAIAKLETAKPAEGAKDDDDELIPFK